VLTDTNTYNGKSPCKDCVKKRAKEYRDRQDPDALKQYQRDYRSKNREAIRARQLEYNRRYREKNRQRLNEYSRQYRKKNRDKQWEADLKCNYGITAVEYYELLDRQSGGCAICGVQENKNGSRLAVDHCHETGRVRGILCHDHNTALGKFRDDVRLLKRAISYLEERA